MIEPMITAAITVTVGLFTLVSGQILQKFFIEPMHDLRRLIGEIGFSLVFYANEYCNPGSGKQENMAEAAKVLRELASRLRSSHYAVPWRRLWGFLGFIPKQVCIQTASNRLIGLSNSVHIGDGSANRETMREIQKLLWIAK